jgi:NADH-quinone oxidoreductase subunit G
MLANIRVSEPKPLQDEDSPLSFTMEGYQGIPPFSMVPFFWAPGWNSVQSVNKYQQEPGGPLRKENPGILLFKKQPGALPAFFKDIPEPFAIRQGKWLLLPQYFVLGSEELSNYSKGIQELSPEPFIGLSKQDAEQLETPDGSVVSVKMNGDIQALPVKIMDELSKGVVVVPTGLQGMEALNWGTWAVISKT